MGRSITFATAQDAGNPYILEPRDKEPRKYYFDGGHVEIVAELVHELDADGKQLRVVNSPTTPLKKSAPSAPTRKNSANAGRIWNNGPK